MTEYGFDEAEPAINEDTIEHHCFGCGNLNPHGLRLRFRPLPEGGVWANFTPTRNQEGYLGMTHGGILATVADEAMSWAITHLGDLAVTARMTLTFRRPAQIGEPLRATAWVSDRRSRVISTLAQIRSAESGDLLVEAEGRFIQVSREQASAWRDAYGEGVESTVFGEAAASSASSRS